MKPGVRELDKKKSDPISKQPVLKPAKSNVSDTSSNQIDRYSEKKNSSLEQQEVADLPDFVKFEPKNKPLSIEEMIEQQKRKDELNRVN